MIDKTAYWFSRHYLTWLLGLILFLPAAFILIFLCSIYYVLVAMFDAAKDEWIDSCEKVTAIKYDFSYTGYLKIKSRYKKAANNDR